MSVVLGMRSGARPRLDGNWYCRRECLHAALEERARRDFASGSRSASARIHHRVPLGLLLQARGQISAGELQSALAIQGKTGEPIRDVLRRELHVEEEAIVAAIAAQWGMPVVRSPGVSGVQVAPPRHLAPAALFHAAGAYPVEQNGSALLLACADSPDPALALALERTHGLRVTFGAAARSTVNHWRTVCERESGTPEAIQCADPGSMAADAARRIHRGQPVDCRLTRVGRHWWLRLWLEEAARQQPGSLDTTDILYSLDSEESQRPA